ANIGVGMGITGTDVTKNVADMVLADDNFATIIGACEEGRRIYDNIRKVIQFLLSANLAEVFSVFAATLMGFTLFQPIQLLWVNLVTDCFPALALGMEEAEGDIMKRKPRNATDGVFANNMGLDTIVQGLIITVLVLASFFCGVYYDLGAIDLSQLATTMADEEGVMMAFITLNMVEIFHCFNMRSRRASIFHMKKQNKWLWGAAILALILTLIVVEVDALSMIFFGVEHLEPKGMITALVLGFLIIPLVEIYKAIMRAVEKDA
ncbi:cation transporting ATPase C-terminal domain-containing protein, partial [Candidatus Collinsella stercoripullorum]|uniref:cation transporting ATPase C-terminal domain-containing protein n=1 Tax=Candidatus Collinsella stercoripullorum TaxID=2838522 RepID=UPI0022E24DCA